MTLVIEPIHFVLGLTALMLIFVAIGWHIGYQSGKQALSLPLNSTDGVSWLVNNRRLIPVGQPRTGFLLFTFPTEGETTAENSLFVTDGMCKDARERYLQLFESISPREEQR